MEALSALLNTAGPAISIKGSRPVQADSFAILGTGENRSFAEVYEQLLAMLPQAASTYGDDQSVDKQFMLANVLDRKAETGDEKSNLPGSQVSLAEILSACPLIQFAKPDDAPEIKATIETIAAAGNKVKPVFSKTVSLTGKSDVAMAQKPTAQPLDVIVSRNLVQPGLDKPTRQGNGGKILTVAEPPGDKPATPASFSTEQAVLDGSVRQTGNESRIKVTPTPVSKNAAATVYSTIIKPDFDKPVSQTGQPGRIVTTAAVPVAEDATATVYSTIIKPDFDKPVRQTGQPVRIVATAGVPVTENGVATVNSGAAQLESEKPVGQTGPYNKIETVPDQPVARLPEAATTGNSKAKPGLNEPIKFPEKEIKIRVTTGQPQHAEAKSTGAENTIRFVNKESVKASGDELKYNMAAREKADKAIITRDLAGEPNQLPGLHNIQVNLEQPGGDKPVMSKSQINLITNHITDQINSGSSNLEIDLRPEALGKVKLMFQMENGSLTVRIIAHTEEAHHLLDTNLQSLKENLNQQGIKISDMTLDFANQEKQGNQTGGGHRDTGRPAKMFVDQKESYENTGTREHASTPYSRLNILA